MAKKKAKPKAAKALPPDPEGMNDDRADWAEEALMAFMAVTGTDPEDAICDLIADLQHLCDRKPDLYGKFSTQLDRGNGHYEEETEGETCSKCHAVEGTPEWGTVGDGYNGMCPSCADKSEGNK